jgi:antitoxin PrlF
MNAITTKGQVTIPKAIRDLLGVRPGGKVDFVMADNGEVVVRKAGTDLPAPLTGSRFGRFRGTLKTNMTTDEIMALTRGDD